MQGLQQVYDEIRALNGEILLIGPETEENSLKFMDKTRSTIPLLYDLDGTVMESYRLMFDAPDDYKAEYREIGHAIVEANPNTGFKLPIPATFVVDGGGTIRARYINADYTYRMEPSDVLAAVRAIASG